MLSSPLLVINGVNFTENIVFGTWKVIDEPMYEQWTDGNYITHKQLKRNKINGQFNVQFYDIESYERFFTTLNENTTRDGYIPAIVYSNNTMVSRAANVFISCDPANTIGGIGTNKDKEISVSIEER